MDQLNALKRSGEGPLRRKLSIGIIALSQIPDDPRVRRQGDAFTRAGWDVVGIGLAGSKSSPPSWPIRDETDLPLPAPVGQVEENKSDPLPKFLPDGLTTGQKLIRLATAPDQLYFAVRKRACAVAVKLGLKSPDIAAIVRRTARVTGLSWTRRQTLRRLGQVRYVLRMQAPRLLPHTAESAFWRLNSRFDDLYRLGMEHRPDIWLANDWTALPIARRLARQSGAILVYDTHELAADEYTERLQWRLLHRPVTVAIEGDCMKEAQLVTCVSDGIADRLQELYGLKKRPIVIRNTPSYQEMPFRPVGERIEVLYHGIVSPGRGLEACIASVAKWRPEFRLTIRGPVSPEYRSHLEARIAENRVGDRVRLVPPVPMTDLVREANAFDIGLFALPDHSRHNRFALPNKFFEYTMAGLALCVSDLPEMARLLKQYDLGVLFAGMEPETIAAAINSFNRESIEHHKRRSLEAARDLNWQKESETLISLCEQLVDTNRKS
ncbi:glycosyltransferase [Microvirga thermotolerans]|uniref:Glycosyltransferase n=1 Tax=Microvirga thermotolerans TaxID=2651334 RepID=A0A5P9JWX1_9HYPH|nr:glycosyltransferase [Microvirga thermotolerans]QFU15920.1 glycosyltransferase [Microvirga thermotolerans]